MALPDGRPVPPAPRALSGEVEDDVGARTPPSAPTPPRPWDARRRLGPPAGQGARRRTAEGPRDGATRPAPRRPRHCVRPVPEDGAPPTGEGRAAADRPALPQTRPTRDLPPPDVPRGQAGTLGRTTDLTTGSGPGRRVAAGGPRHLGTAGPRARTPAVCGARWGARQPLKPFLRGPACETERRP